MKPRFPEGGAGGGRKKWGVGGRSLALADGNDKISGSDQRLPGAAGTEFPGEGGGARKGRWQVAGGAGGGLRSLGSM